MTDTTEAIDIQTPGTARHILVQLQKKAIKNLEELTAAGAQVSEEAGLSQMVLGYIAGEVETGYGKDAMGQFAAEIGRPKGTIIKYRRVAAAFRLETFLEFNDIPYSFYEVLAFKVKDAGLREQWLPIVQQERLGNNLSVDGLTARLLGNEIPMRPKPLVVQAGQFITMDTGGGFGVIGLAVENIEEWVKHAKELGFLTESGEGRQAKLTMRLPDMKAVQGQEDAQATTAQEDAPPPASRGKRSRKKAQA